MDKSSQDDILKQLLELNDEYCLQVYLRIKAGDANYEELYEVINSCTLISKIPEGSNSVRSARDGLLVKKKYHFSKIYGPETRQEDLFDELVKPKLSKFISGENCTLMTYGVSSSDFQNNIPEMVTVHWDGKLLPGLDVRSSIEERLPILISFGENEQLLAVPKLESSSGEDQAKAVLNALYDWNIDDKVQIMCCDTTASNTGRLKGACVLLEQKLDRELVLSACRHHVYELVLKCVFETKIQKITNSLDIPLFKKFRDNWKTINPAAIQTFTNFARQHFCNTTIDELLTFYNQELQKPIVRDDYQELIELSIIFLGGDKEKKN